MGNSSEEVNDQRERREVSVGRTLPERIEVKTRVDEESVVNIVRPKHYGKVHRDGSTVGV